METDLINDNVNQSENNNKNFDELIISSNKGTIKRENGLKNFFRLTFLLRLSSFNAKRALFFKRKPLLGYSIKRVVFAAITFYIAMAIVMLLMISVISDSTWIQNADMKQIASDGGIGGPTYLRILAQVKHEMGVDIPAYRIILNWWLNISFFIPVCFEKGSYVNHWFSIGFVLSGSISTEGYSVLDLFKQAIPFSFKIGCLGFLAGYVVGIPLGIVCAQFKNKKVDKSINLIAIFLQATPGLIIVSIIYVFAITSFGASANYISGGFETKIYAYITMFILVVPQIVIDVRRYVIDEMTADYTKFAKSKGLSDSYIFTIHIFRVAGVRVLRIIPTALILSLFGSSLLTELYWNVPGMSKLILQGIEHRDLYVVMGYVTISAMFGIITSLVADLITAILDPRVSLIK